MFDIGFSEIIVVAVVGLLVIGPERLPATIRTASLWLNRLRRSFNEIKGEIEQELHNDAIMEELRKARDQFKGQVNSLGQDLESAAEDAFKAETEIPQLSEPAPTPDAKPEEAKAAPPSAIPPLTPSPLPPSKPGDA